MASTLKTSVEALPVEIVVSIFSIAIYSTVPTIAQDSIPTSGITSNPEDFCTPIVLSHVCNAWRTLCLSSTDLWSTIYITRATTGHIHLLELWLSRSGTRLLDLTLRDGSGWSDASTPYLVQVFKILCRAGSRWRSFSIEKSRSWWPAEISTHLANHAPLQTLQTLQLETLTFELRPAAPYAAFYNQWKRVIASSPKLKRLALSFMPIQYDESRLGVTNAVLALSTVVPWGRLTSLCLTAVSLLDMGSTRKSFYDMLSACNKLETLSVSLDDHTLSPKPDWPVVTLAKLRTFNTVGRRFLPTLMDTLNLPNLLYLSIHTETTVISSHNAYSSFSELLSRSNCHLKSFSFRDCNNDAVQSLNTLLTHPCLSDLSNLRVGSRVDDTTPSKMVHTPDTAPSVCHLTLDSVMPYHLIESSSPFVSLVLSRHPVLHFLEVNFESQANFASELSSWGHPSPQIGRRLGRVDRRYKCTGSGFGTRSFGKELRCGDFSMALDDHLKQHL
jgi:hypothetical protein